MATNAPTPEWDRATSLILKRLIHEDFTNFVKVDNVLPKFIRILDSEGRGILSDVDIQMIKTRNKYDGDIKGAEELLERLSQYFPHWFTVLQDVLRNPDVKQTPLAESFEKYLDTAYAMRLNQTIAVQQRGENQNQSAFVRSDSTSCHLNRAPFQQQQQHSMHNLNIGDQFVRSDGEDDFDLDDDNALMSDMPRPHKPDENDSAQQDSSLPKDVPGTEEASGTDDSLSQQMEELTTLVPDTNSQCELTTLVAVTNPQCELATPVCNPTPKSEESSQYENMEDGSSSKSQEVKEDNQTQKSSEYDELEFPVGATGGGASSARPPGADSQYENASCRSSTRAKLPLRKRSSTDVKKRLVREFSFAETERALSQYEGWHPSQTDRNVVLTFRDILEEKKDGRYLLMFWEKKKRPAICVSYGGKLITFVIHRRRDKSGAADAGYIYYVDENVTKPSLAELFAHHKEHGLPNLKNESGSTETIPLSYPIYPDEDLPGRQGNARH